MSGMFDETPTYVSIYFVERAYGGPEEGGWYYDRYYHELSVPVWTDEEREKEIARISSHIPKPKYPLHSVLSQGEYVVLSEETIGENETKERPTYY